MATLDLTLLANGTTYISEADYNDGDLLNLNLVGAHTIVVDGVEVGINSLVGVGAAKALTVVAGHGGTVNIDQGLLQLDLLSALNFKLDGKGEINLDGGALGALTGLLNSYKVNYAGGHTGIFSYTPPTLNVLNVTTFVVDDMQPGDQFNIMGSARSWSPEDTEFWSLGVQPYSDGYFQIINRSLLAETHVNIRMTAAQAEALEQDWDKPADQRQYWKPVIEGGERVGFSFIFPGSYLCYGDGAMVLTVAGYRPVESLKAGDLLVCADGTARALLWKSASQISATMLDTRPDLRPIRIGAGALGEGYPSADLVVSPQHRIWVDGPAIRSLTGGTGGLIAAKHLLGLPGIVAHECDEGLRYHHLLMADHEILMVNGILSESLHLGSWTLRTLDPAARLGLDAVMPLLVAGFGTQGQSRHPLLTGRVARQAARLYGRRRDMFFEAPGQYRHAPPSSAAILQPAE